MTQPGELHSEELEAMGIAPRLRIAGLVPRQQAKADLFSTLLLTTHATIASLLVAWPVSRMVAGIYGNHPDGELALTRDGAVGLLDLGVRAPWALQLPVPWIGAIALVVAFTSPAIMAMGVGRVACCTERGRRPPLSMLAALATKVFHVVLLVRIVLLGLQAATLTGIVFGGGFLWRTAADGSRREGLQLGTLALAVVSTLALQALGDGTVVACVTRGDGPWKALRRAWATLLRAKTSLAWGCAWRTCLGHTIQHAMLVWMVAKGPNAVVFFLGGLVIAFLRSYLRIDWWAHYARALR